MFDAIAGAERRWGLQFKRKNPHEYSSACPFCHAGTDRFLIFAEGNYWCRQCNVSGWIDENDKRRLTPDELEKIRMEQRVRALERQAEEHERRLTALERMSKCRDHISYHQAVYDYDAAMDYWLSEGISFDSIERYQLGYCQRCPTDNLGRPSYTIPVVQGGKLLNIRHRLTNAPSGDKYRPHMAGLGNQLFNADAVLARPDSIAIVEGEKKSIVVAQAGFANVGIVGKRAFKPEWVEWFRPVKLVYVALDPDARESAYRLGAMFGNRARVVDLPAKIDDMIVRYGATPDDLRHFFKVARPIKGGIN